MIKVITDLKMIPEFLNSKEITMLWAFYTPFLKCSELRMTELYEVYVDSKLNIIIRVFLWCLPMGF